MDRVTVSPKYQVVIPRRVREQFGLSPGQTLQVIALPGRIELVPSQPPAALRACTQACALVLRNNAIVFALRRRTQLVYHRGARW